MKRLVVVVLAVALLIGCQLRPASGGTCDGVSAEVCAVALEQVVTLFEGSGEVVHSASVSPSGRAECLHDERPLADVVVHLEGRAEPVLMTISRTLAGEPSVCF